jgi:hypothetical protein
MIARYVVRTMEWQKEDIAEGRRPGPTGVDHLRPGPQVIR